MPERIHRRHDVVPQQGLEKYGATLFADSTNKKYPIDTPGRIKAAWAYIQARRVALPDPDEFVELMKRVRKKR